MKAPKNGGGAVKNCRRGGHRSARSEAEEEREEAAEVAWTRSLTARGQSPPETQEGSRQPRRSLPQPKSISAKNVRTCGNVSYNSERLTKSRKDSQRWRP
jgi:hypothetical protein